MNPYNNYYPPGSGWDQNQSYYNNYQPYGNVPPNNNYNYPTDPNQYANPGAPPPAIGFCLPQQNFDPNYAPNMNQNSNQDQSYQMYSQPTENPPRRPPPPNLSGYQGQQPQSNISAPPTSQNAESYSREIQHAPRRPAPSVPTKEKTEKEKGLEKLAQMMNEDFEMTDEDFQKLQRQHNINP